MDRIVFTICSNNYLAQAKTLGDSLLQHNPNYKFIIVICDTKSEEVDYSIYKDFSVLFFEDLNILEFDEMKKLYNILELNTGIKPFIFDYIYKNFDAASVFYFDPDIVVFDKFTAIEDELTTADMLLTPHLLSPRDSLTVLPTEIEISLAGLYNLGFLATKKSHNTQQMLDWWKKRLRVNCFDRRYAGIFVDQLPMIHAPIFFNNVKVSKNPGLNVAPWNLYERTLTEKSRKLFINKNVPMIFFHFSGYSPFSPERMTKYYKTQHFDDFPKELKEIYDTYKELLFKNNYNNLISIKCNCLPSPSKLENFLYNAQRILIFVCKKIDKYRIRIRTRRQKVSGTKSQ